MPKAAGYDNSMGLVRYYLAFAVFIEHFNIISDTFTWFPTSSYNAVGGFFALSGFLIYPSYLKRGNVKDYLLRRGRRILPPYIFIVLLAAFGLVFVSTLPAKEYFFNMQWVRYLVCNLTFLNFLCPELPGVFQNLPVHAVNGSLWTMKVEVFLYLSVPLVAGLFAWLRKKVRWFGPACMFGAIYLLSAAYRLYFLELYDSTEKEIYNILSRQVFGQLMYFYGGVYVYFIFDKFKRYRHIILAACIVIILCADYLPYFVYKVCVSPAVVVCMVIYFSQFAFASIFDRNNISYDIYLYHMPVILVIYTVIGDYGLPVWAMFSISVACTVLLGALSWFCIGKKFLRR